VSAPTFPLVSSLAIRRATLIEHWDRTSARNQTMVKVVVLVAVVVAAYHYSLSSLTQTLGFDTPLAYIGLVPFFAAGLAWIRRHPRATEPQIHDRQLDYIIGIPLVVGSVVVDYVLPEHLGLIYWLDRIDVLTLPFFVAGVVALLFGTRVLWRQKVSIAYLLLAWPWPYTTVLLGALGGFTDITVSGLTEALKFLPVAHTVPGQSNVGLFEVVHHGQTFPVSVITACSGVDGMVGFLLVGVGFASLVTGPGLRKTLWLLSGLVVLWCTNLLRLLLIFWVGQHFGESVAIGTLHPIAGVVLFCVGIVLMIILLKPFGLRFADIGRSPTPGPSAKHPAVREAVPRIFLASSLLAIVGILLAINNSALRTFDPVASAAGLPKLTSFIADPGSPPGWEAGYVTQYTQNKPLFGESSIWNRYAYGESAAHTISDLTSSLPVIADVINAGGLSGFEQYGVTACYSFHGYQLRDVAKVDLGQGINGQALSFSSTNGYNDWTIVYWIMPVNMASGTRYERVVLYLQNTSYGTVVAPHDVQGISGLNGALRTTSAVDRRLIINRAFLVDFARQLLLAQTHQSDPGVTLHAVASAHPLTPPPSASYTVDQKLIARARAIAAAHRELILKLENEGKVPDGTGGVYESSNR
jgi:exosortase